MTVRAAKALARREINLELEVEIAIRPGAQVAASLTNVDLVINVVLFPVSVTVISLSRCPQSANPAVRSSSLSLLSLYSCSDFYPSPQAAREQAHGWGEHMITIIEPCVSPPTWLVIFPLDICSSTLPVATQEGNPFTRKNHHGKGTRP
jgi:hypothetical protein